MKPVLLEDATAALRALSSLADEKSKLITFDPWWPYPGGTAGTGLLSACSELKMGSRFSASLVTASSQKEKTVSEGKLKDRLKKLLEDEQRREVAKRIELACTEICGEDNFIFGYEAKIVAEIDLAKFNAVCKRVNEIRHEMDEAYHLATLSLTEVNNE